MFIFFTFFSFIIPSIHFVHSQSNLLEGDFPGFEGTTAEVFASDKWTISSSSISSSTSVKRSGNRSARFSNPTSSYGGRSLRSLIYSIEGGEIYYWGAWFWVNRESGDIEDTDFRIRVFWLDSSQVEVDSSPGSTGFSLSTFESWQEQSITNTAPSNTVYAYLLLEGKESLNNNNDVFIDDVYFFKLADNTNANTNANTNYIKINILNGLGENFEGELFPPLHWQTNGTLDKSDSYKVSGDYSVRFNSSSDVLITPCISNVVLLSYKVRASAGESAFSVLFSTNDSVSWENLPGSPTGRNYNGEFTEESWDLIDYRLPIQFRFQRSGGKTYYLDDVFAEREKVSFIWLDLPNRVVSPGEKNISVGAFSLRSTLPGAEIQSLTLFDEGQMPTNNIESLKLYIDNNFNLAIDVSDILLGDVSLPSFTYVPNSSTAISITNGIWVSFLFGLSFKADADGDQSKFIAAINPSSILISNTLSSNFFPLPNQEKHLGPEITLRSPGLVHPESRGVVRTTLLDKNSTEIFFEQLKIGSTIIIFNSYGNRIDKIFCETAEVRWSIPKNLSSGVYFAKIQQDDLEKIIKLIILR